jgi:ABC-type polysaccharide/polyol phosphate transport system ATPase subunit
MSDDSAISVSVERVSKIFRLPHEKQTSVKSALINFRRRGYEEQKVLDDVSFEIKQGEFFGIVGRNGSGKSTLLKLLAGIYTPTKGNINVNGKLTPFIELGVGFNPELTGRENVFLNGALLGFSRKEVEAMYNQIVEFAELERFMGQKLKNYSSGMQVRLAFSIAIQAKSDILVLDEVLAVGDEAFQQKCTKVFEQYKAKKQTIVLVTHDMAVVERFCTRALMLKDGKIVKIGSPSAVARLYSEANKDAYAAEQQAHEEQLYSDKISVALLDSKTKQPKKRFKRGETLLVRLSWSRKDVEHAGVAIMKQSGEYIFGPNTFRDKAKLNLKGKNKLYYAVKLDLGTGEYFVKAGLFGETDSDVLEFVDEGPSFSVETSKADTVWGGITHMKHNWGDKNVEL